MLASVICCDTNGMKVRTTLFLFVSSDLEGLRVLDSIRLSPTARNPLVAAVDPVINKWIL